MLEQAHRDGQPLPRQEGLWVVAPRAPRWLRDSFELAELAPGCFRVGPAWFQFLWIASNELPLQDELVPFLVTRSGLARDEFVLWVAQRRPLEWVWNMLQYVKVRRKTLEELKQQFAPKEDPEDEARSVEALRWMLDVRPAVKQELIEEGIEHGRLVEAREALRRVFVLRGLPLAPEQEVAIDGCNDLPTLKRWHDQAIIAASAIEALT